MKSMMMNDDGLEKYTFIQNIGVPVSTPYLSFKRVCDVFFGSILLIISTPLIIAFGILVKATSTGPIFFKQERVGIMGKTFKLIKLRSMYNGAEKSTGAVWAQKNDSRVTAVGRFMRRTRIDELPQFWNVLKGDMSLIGPRPERPELTEEFSKSINIFPERLQLRPGITGYAQVHGGYDIDPESKAKLDVYYIKHLSLFMELKIVFQTIGVVFTGEGAR